MSFLGAADLDVSFDFDPAPPLPRRAPEEIPLPETPEARSSVDNDALFVSPLASSAGSEKPNDGTAPLNVGLLIDIGALAGTPVKTPIRPKGMSVQSTWQLSGPKSLE